MELRPPLFCIDFCRPLALPIETQERTKNAQFIIISLRNNMFELADRLVGIYKTNDATKSVPHFSSSPMPSRYPPIPYPYLALTPARSSPLASSSERVFPARNATRSVAIDPAAFTIAAR